MVYHDYIMDSPECFQLNIFKFPKAHSNLDLKNQQFIADGALPEGNSVLQRAGAVYSNH